MIGASAAGGMALALWSCNDGGKPAAPADSQPATQPTTSPATAASHPAPATTRSATAPASQTAPTAQTQAQTQTQPATAAEAGEELFPDSNGRPLAHASDAPVILVPRAQWTTIRPRMNEIVLMNGIGRITVHHTAGATETDAWKPTAASLEGIREFHAGPTPINRGWADIAYHFAIDRAGRVWQARPLFYQGAHARQHNDHNAGVVLLGDFEVQSPSAAQLTALGLFITFLRSIYHVPLPQVFTHGELVETECPGKSLQEFMDRHRTSAAATEGTVWQPTATRPIPDASLPPLPAFSAPATGPATER